jgi:LAO/AO transport system ATPase
MPDELLDRFRHGDRLALARLLTLIGRGQPAEDILHQLGPAAKPSRVVAVTGSGGVGKSTLIGKLIEYLRGQGQTVAVLACDPQSPLTGGALLGDRFRMPSRADDDGVFIRSLAALSGSSALAAHLDPMIRLLERFGFDVVLVETVGAGQGDTAVRELADVVVLLLQPESGDELQWEKAGLLEVADVVAVHKADLPGAEAALAQVKATLGLSPHQPPVVMVSAKRGTGLEELWRAVAACPLRRQSGRDVQALLRAAQQELARRFFEAERDPDVAELVRRWQEGGAQADSGVQLLRALAAFSPEGATVNSQGRQPLEEETHKER